MSPKICTIMTSKQRYFTRWLELLGDTIMLHIIYHICSIIFIRHIYKICLTNLMAII